MLLTVGPDNINAQRIFCIGRNYVEHVKELQNELPDQPVVFMKPSSCLVEPGQQINFPSHGHDLHHEVEIVVLIGSPAKNISEKHATTVIKGLTVGLDLTLRDVQQQLKQKGLPWEKAKAFDQSSPIGIMTPYTDTISLETITFSCSVNNTIRQEGNSTLMIFSITRLISELSSIWELLPGDLIYTGTPSGVGPLHKKDTVTIHSDLFGTFTWEIV